MKTEQSQPRFLFWLSHGRIEHWLMLDVMVRELEKAAPIEYRLSWARQRFSALNEEIVEDHDMESINEVVKLLKATMNDMKIGSASMGKTPDGAFHENGNDEGRDIMRFLFRFLRRESLFLRRALDSVSVARASSGEWRGVP